MVYGLWFMVYGLWFMVYGLWLMVCDLRDVFRRGNKHDLSCEVLGRVTCDVCLVTCDVLRVTCDFCVMRDA